MFGKLPVDLLRDTLGGLVGIEIEFDGVGCQVAHIFGSRKEEGSDPEVGGRVGVQHLSGEGSISDGLDIANGSIFLQGGMQEVVVAIVYCILEVMFGQQSLIDAPSDGIEEECGTACFRSGSEFGIGKASCPIPFGLLQGTQGIRHLRETSVQGRIEGMGRWKVLQDLCEGSDRPSIASCPEVFAIVIGLVGGIDVACIPIVEVFVGIVEQAVGEEEAGLHLVEIASISG